MSNFKLDIDIKDRKIKEYVRLFEVARNEYRKIVQENNLLKRQILRLRQQSHLKQKTQAKRKYIVEDSDDSDTDNSPYEIDYHGEKEQLPEKKVKTKTVKKTKSKNYLSIQAKKNNNTM